MSSGRITLVGANGTSTSITVTRPGGHSTTDTITIAAPPSLDHMDYTLSSSSATVGGSAPTGTVTKWQDAGETTPFTGSVSLSYTSSNTAVATINSSTGVITLVAAGSCTFTVTDSISTKTATTGTLTVSASGTPTGQAVSTLYLAAPFTATPLSYAAANPSGTKSSALPLTTHSGTGSWRAMTAGTVQGGPVGTYQQATGGASTQSVWFGGWVSDTLSAQTIPTGTYTVKIGAYTESSNPYKLAPVLYVWRPGTDAVVGTLYDSATGLGTATTSSQSTDGRVVSFTVGSGVTCQDGDRLVMELYFVGTGNDYIHMIYSGHSSATVDGGATDISEIDFPSPIYLQPYGTIRVGPTGRRSSTGALTTISVASDAEFRSKAFQAAYGSLWDSTATSKKGSASVGYLDGSSLIDVDLMNVDTSVTFTDRDSVTRNTLHVIIRPAGGAPLSSANDSLAASSAHPEGLFSLAPGRTFSQWYQRQLVKFNPGFRLDCPNNTTSNASGFNQTQSGAYKIGPHPTNAVTRADFEISGGQTYGSEYLTGNFGSYCTTDNNYSAGTMATLMPNWNTAGDVWEIIRVQRINGDGTATHAIYMGKVTDTTLTKVYTATRTLDPTTQLAQEGYSTWPPMTSIGIVGKNFNRQLASTDTPPELWVSDVEFADITDPNWSWPSQIAVGDRI